MLGWVAYVWIIAILPSLDLFWVFIHHILGGYAEHLNIAPQLKFPGNREETLN